MAVTGFAAANYLNAAAPIARNGAGDWLLAFQLKTPAGAEAEGNPLIPILSLDDTGNPAVRASDVLSVTVSENFADGEEVSIGDTTYTFVDALAPAPNSAVRGSDAELTRDGILAALASNSALSSFSGASTNMINMEFTASPWLVATNSPDIARSVSGLITFTGNPTAGQTITVGAVTYTFVAGAPGTNEVQIGANEVETGGNMIAALASNASLSNVENGGTDDVVNVVFVGNNGTLATNASNVTLVRAAAILISDNPDLGRTLTVGGVTYTFVAGGAGAAGEVLVGRNGGESVSNLAAAINGTAPAGAVYGQGTVANPDVTAEADELELTVTSRLTGADGNGVLTTTDAAEASWDEGELTGGVDATGDGSLGGLDQLVAIQFADTEGDNAPPERGDGKKGGATLVTQFTADNAARLWHQGAPGGAEAFIPNMKVDTTYLVVVGQSTYNGLVYNYRAVIETDVFENKRNVVLNQAWRQATGHDFHSVEDVPLWDRIGGYETYSGGSFQIEKVAVISGTLPITVKNEVAGPVYIVDPTTIGGVAYGRDFIEDVVEDAEIEAFFHLASHTGLSDSAGNYANLTVTGTLSTAQVISASEQYDEFGALFNWLSNAGPFLSIQGQKEGDQEYWTKRILRATAIRTILDANYGSNLNTSTPLNAFINGVYEDALDDIFVGFEELAQRGGVVPLIPD